MYAIIAAVAISLTATFAPVSAPAQDVVVPVASFSISGAAGIGS